MFEPASRLMRRGITLLQTLTGLLLIVVLTVVAMVMGDCTLGPEDTADFAPNNQSEAVFLAPTSPMFTLLTSMGWANAKSPLYTDDQRLLGDGGAYGQYARIFPSQVLDTLTEAGMAQPAGTAGVLVAIMEVHTDTEVPSLPGTYQDMDVALGVNCIYLRSGSPWRAYVAPQTASGGCAENYSDATPLTVKVDTFLTPPPPVVRFAEGSNATRGIVEGAPYVTLKCGIAWCSLHHANVTPMNAPQTEDDDTETPYAVPGWGDAQHLSELSTAGTMTRTSQKAYVVPVANLGSISPDDFKSGFQHVANVIFMSAPSGKYVSKWDFDSRTDNELYLKSDATGTKWKAKTIRRIYWGPIPSPFKKTTVHKIAQDPHPGMTLAPTARFNWSPLDEDLWVRCNDGCCKVSPQ